MPAETDVRSGIQSKVRSVGTFSLFTLAGSGLWNGALIGLGYLLGTQYQLIEKYSHFLNYAVYAALAVAVALLIIRRAKRAKRVDADR